MMSEREQWEAVDRFIEERLLDADPVLDAVMTANREAGLAAIDVSPLQGQFLALMVRVSGARHILEIGTLGGYSAICMARALPHGGTLTSLEFDLATADVAQANIERAGLSDRVTVIIGAALDTLPTLTGTYDLFFIDADKKNNATYLDWAVKLARPGSLIIVDNVIRAGGVIDPAKTDPHTMGNKAMFEAMKTHPQLDATALQTVGSKGWDGFLMAVVRGET